MAQQYFTGTVKSWNTEKGWGHIQCPQTEQEFGKDVFLLRSQLVGMKDVSKGEVVSFNVVNISRGPEATNVQYAGYQTAQPSQSHPSYQRLHQPPYQPPYAPPYQQSWGYSAAAAAGGDSTYTGTVKSWNPVKGWGHIESAQVTGTFGKDMFFMKSQVPAGEIRKGLTVRFSVQQGVKGPEALNIQVVQGSTMNGMNGMQGGMKGQRQQPMQQHQQHVVPTQFQQTKTAEVYFGTVKGFREDKGWGHIECQRTLQIYGKDMFFMRSCLVDGTVPIGENVQFSVRMGTKGPEAHNVRGMAFANGSTFLGSIKQFTLEKGFGFISCDETRAVYNRDIFIHNKELHGVVPSPGDRVQFTVELAGDGRPEATNVSVVKNAFGAPGGGVRSSPY